MQINPKVVDISHWDDVEVQNGQWTGFMKLKAAGYVGVINKVTQGKGLVDKSYARRRIHATSVGLMWGGYHWLDQSSPEEQAAHFLDEVKVDANTLMALDFEQRGTTLGAAKIFMEAVKQQTGRYPWLYSGFLVKELIGKGIDPYWSQIKLWLSHYSANPTWPATWTKPTLWQFTGDGLGPGPHTAPGISIPNGCDINSFDGTDDELRAIWIT